MSQQMERMFNPGSSDTKRPGLVLLVGCLFLVWKSLKTTYPISPWKKQGLEGGFKTYQLYDFIKDMFFFFPSESCWILT